jgi:hypothetical protein
VISFSGAPGLRLAPDSCRPPIFGPAAPGERAPDLWPPLRARICLFSLQQFYRLGAHALLELPLGLVLRATERRFPTRSAGWICFCCVVHDLHLLWFSLPSGAGAQSAFPLFIWFFIFVLPPILGASAPEVFLVFSSPTAGLSLACVLRLAARSSPWFGSTRWFRSTKSSVLRPSSAAVRFFRERRTPDFGLHPYSLSLRSSSLLHPAVAGLVAAPSVFLFGRRFP